MDAVQAVWKNILRFGFGTGEGCSSRAQPQNSVLQLTRDTNIVRALHYIFTQRMRHVSAKVETIAVMLWIPSLPVCLSVI